MRTKSVIEKAGGIPTITEIKPELLFSDKKEFIKKLNTEYNWEKILQKCKNNFEDILMQVTEKNEPSILSRYLIDVAKSYSNFYNENKIITNDKDTQNARVFLTYAVGNILKIGAKLLGIEMPDRM